MRRRMIVLFATTVIVVSAMIWLFPSSGANTPVQAAGQLLTAMQEQDANRAQRASCGHLAGSASLFARSQAEFEQIRLEEIARSTTSATVRVTGSLVVRSAAYPLNWQITLERSGKHWCVVEVINQQPPTGVS